MIAMQLKELELEEFVLENQPSLRVKATLPLADTPGTESLGVVYFEIDPGEALMIHTDSRDEIVALLSGAGLARVGDKTGHLSSGGMVFIPADVPHGFRNTGRETLRAVGVFAGADFESEVMPDEQQTFEPPVGSPPGNQGQPGGELIAWQWSDLDFQEMWIEGEPGLRWRLAEHLAETGATDSLDDVYFELAPGEVLETHTHSEDETVLLLSGTGEGLVGEKTSRISTGGLVFIPADAPHGFCNTGEETLRAFGAFPGSNVVTTFNSTVMPFGISVFGSEESDEALQPSS
jgi:quercetin dioxygenase-like cupin family protein